MVETQQGISTFLSFGAKSVKPEILEELLVGRRENIEYLSKSVAEIVQNGINHQIMVVGQRGMGKTHLLRVLYQRSQVFLQEKKIVIAYFSEEEYGISGYLDFLIRVLNAFIRWNDKDRDSLKLQMDMLRETHSNRQIDVAESIIREYVGNKPLLILAENFDDILQTLGKDGQGKLRSFLYIHNRTSIIATSQALSPDLGKEDRPFYNFFTTIYLKKISYEDSLALLRRLAEMEGQSNVIEHLKGKGIAQIRAIHDLVKGNHRLLITFYEFLKADTLASLSKIFIKTLNDLKPYYETFIRYLPPLQQKILHYVALSKMPQNGNEISKNCFIDQKTLSKQLSELQRRNLLDAIVDPDNKRNRLYDISEPLLRISIEIGEHREGLAALFIDFLALYYSHDELKNQKSRILGLYECENDPQIKQDLWHDLVAREKAIALQESLERIKNKKGDITVDLIRKKIEEKDFRRAIELALQIPEYQQDGSYFFDLGYIYDALEDYDNAILSFQKGLLKQPDYNETWTNLGSAYYSKCDFKNAIKSYKKAIELKKDVHKAWYNLGNTYRQIGDIEKAIKSYQEAIELKNDDDRSWYNLGVIFVERGQVEKAIESYQKATEIKNDKFEAWCNLGYIYINQNNKKRAIEAFEKAIETGATFIKYENWFPREIVLGEISNCFIYILKTDKNLILTKIKNLESIIENEYEMPEELEIPYKYLQIYRRYVLEKEQKAILELPKEQREFFKREILG
jgi:tetratricopeptide (TPR) repeat protein